MLGRAVHDVLVLLIKIEGLTMKTDNLGVLGVIKYFINSSPTKKGLFRMQKVFGIFIENRRCRQRWSLNPERIWLK